MPFWGIEVKPGKSYTYPVDSVRRKLRLTQASLGTGKSNGRATLQINLGKKKPIILCNLLPNVCENFSMQLAFEESEDVLFSVLGERSVHLAGYLVDKLDGNESDSIGEAIENTESSASYGDGSDLDKYESDFIDDDDDDEVTVLPSPKCAKELNEASCGNKSGRRLKKAYEVDLSDHRNFEVGSKYESIFSIESDDTDDSLLASSFQKKKREGKKSSLETDSVSESENDGGCKGSKKKIMEKKKSKKSKDASPLAVEENQNPSVIAPHKNEHDDDIDKKERAKKQTSEVAITDGSNDKLVSEAATHSEDDGKKKRKAKKRKERTENKDESHLALASEATDPSSLVASDTTQQNAGKANKKSKKRARSEVPEL